jgi:transcriptional regulator with XRE-family HTH domain
MKEANPIEFGNRVRERRRELRYSQERLAGLTGYSQTNIGWIEKGQAKRPHIQAPALAEALNTTTDWLLWENGPKDATPSLLTDEQVKESYNLLSNEDRAAISEAIVKRIEAAKEKRRAG